MSIRDFRQSLGQRILVGIMLVGVGRIQVDVSNNHDCRSSFLVRL